LKIYKLVVYTDILMDQTYEKLEKIFEFSHLINANFDKSLIKRLQSRLFKIIRLLIFEYLIWLRSSTLVRNSRSKPKRTEWMAHSLWDEFIFIWWKLTRLVWMWCRGRVKRSLMKEIKLIFWFSFEPKYLI